jgi:ubiquinone/menaquinone biosynthesis C-methylase UbiE
MFSRGAWCLGIGLLLFLINRAEYPGPAGQLLGVLGSMGLVFLAVGGFMLWSSKVAKLELRDRIIDSLALNGEEKVLDVGCGRGLLMIGVAKRLRAGRSTGIDIWNPQDLSKNTADAAKENAKLEGVADKIRIENHDARKLPYPDNSYDVVVSNLAIHNIDDRDGREQAIREMFRVLKPGGKLVIHDIFRTGEYAETLRGLNAKNVELSPTSWLWCVPARTLTAGK